MNQFRGIPVVQSGKKYRNTQGVTAVKDGIKLRDTGSEAPLLAKPPWLKMRIPSGAKYGRVKQTVHEHKLSTVCEESMCPNIGECWSNGTATIMLMGAVCTRACKFCAVDTGNPHGWLDSDEPKNVQQIVR